MSRFNVFLVALLAAVLLIPAGAASVAQASPSEGTWSYGGYTLTPPPNPEATDAPEDVIAAARAVRERAADMDKAITKQMIDAANAHGARLEGLEFRLKSEQSIARKVQERAALTGKDPMAIAEELSDITRYTMVFPRQQYAASAVRVLKDLEEEGSALRIKNYWQQGDPYQGINVAITTSDDLKVELQFHTPGSIKAKEVIHKYYEAFRESTNNDKRWSLYKRMVRIAMKIPMPSWRVFTIGVLEFNGFVPIT